MLHVDRSAVPPTTCDPRRWQSGERRVMLTASGGLAARGSSRSRRGRAGRPRRMEGVEVVEGEGVRCVCVCVCVCARARASNTTTTPTSALAPQTYTSPLLSYNLYLSSPITNYTPLLSPEAPSSLLIYLLLSTYLLKSHPLIPLSSNLFLTHQQPNLKILHFLPSSYNLSVSKYNFQLASYNCQRG